jgi:hypothetical protein
MVASSPAILNDNDSSFGYKLSKQMRFVAEFEADSPHKSKLRCVKLSLAFE